MWEFIREEILENGQVLNVFKMSNGNKVITKKEPKPETPEVKYKTLYSKRNFILNILKHDEWDRFKKSAQTNTNVGQYYDALFMSKNIDLTDPDLIRGLHALKELGLIEEHRVIEILTPKEVIDLG